MIKVTKSANAILKRKIFGAVLMYELVKMIKQVSPFPGIPIKRRAL